MARLVVFSKFFGFSAGGAEKSVLEALKQGEASGDQVVAYVSSRPPSHGGVNLERLDLPSTWTIEQFRLPVQLNRFRHAEYLVTREYVRRLARRVSADVAYSYGHLAPAFLNSFPGKRIYSVRDEYGLGWNVNYYRGLRGIAQSLYHASEAYARSVWRDDLLRCIETSELVTNSNFMASELKRIAPDSKITVQYPAIDATALLAEYNSAEPSLQPGVIAVGNNVLKGADVVRATSKLLPMVPFYLFDRSHRSISRQGNLHLMPWTNSGAMFRLASVVIIPSRWAEAYCRVTIEARLLQIPVLAARRGGIPEAIEDPRFLLDPTSSPSVWAASIQQLLSRRSYEK